MVRGERSVFILPAGLCQTGGNCLPGFQSRWVNFLVEPMSANQILKFTVWTLESISRIIDDRGLNAGSAWSLDLLGHFENWAQDIRSKP